MRVGNSLSQVKHARASSFRLVVGMQALDWFQGSAKVGRGIHKYKNKQRDRRRAAIRIQAIVRGKLGRLAAAARKKRKPEASKASQASCSICILWLVSAFEGV